MEKITILIVDDHTLVREMWAVLLNEDPRFSVIAEAGSGEQAIELVKKFQPGITIMDINLPGMNGIEATGHICKNSPCAKVLALSIHAQPVYAREMMKCGACGYVTKNSTRQEMMEAIVAVYAGEKYICNEIKDVLSREQLEGKSPDAWSTLSGREIEIITYLKKGLTSKQIAGSLNLSYKTIEAHRHRILKKLQIKNTIALINIVSCKDLFDCN